LNQLCSIKMPVSSQKKETMDISKSLIITSKIQLSSWINKKKYRKSTPKTVAIDIRKTKAIVTTKLSKMIMKRFPKILQPKNRVNRTRLK
jgi:hypothetical protein